MKNLNKVVLAVALSAFSVASWAVPSVPSTAVPVAGDTCGSPDRTATLTGASHCASDSGINFDAADIQSIYPSDPWSMVSEFTADGSDMFFTATSNEGWGSIPNSGTWGITEAFWSVYDEAVISMHIGEGAGDPDAWAWLITPDTLSGDWSLSFIDGGLTSGGGLSNLKLWGRTDDTTVPEPGMVALLAIGLIGMTVARRKLKV